ncbi:hypothetical protein DSCO28_70650 [Desulfosarcina ovata subsp. sediminis]|uniref:Uncharacterized protein n=1 Tax=Desulfosarcina ovata subsp. sediminis TaxID=885957 RepID=A0A5K8A1R6_9BACT|nr:hypothetical protein [Desulfosarcina ovata]BBO86499.1 hypothetical protein DSCO28_70650 [Desulfosarcina ovata subsp. sediminis]
MPTHPQLVSEVTQCYRIYGNAKYCRPSFVKASKTTLFKLIEQHAHYNNTTCIQRPPTPIMQKLRGEAYDAYKDRMRAFFHEVGAIVSVDELNVPQTDVVANFLAGIRYPDNRFYEQNYTTPTFHRSDWENKLLARLSEYACREYFPVSLSGLSVKKKEKIYDFLNHYECRQKIRPPLPKSKKLFLQDYYQYRERAQSLFDKVDFPVGVAYLTLSMIEALLNFMVGHRHPKMEQYKKVFAANSVSPVTHFVSMYKPYGNKRYPISVGQYHGRKDQIRALLFFSPVKKINRWFSPPPSTKIKNERTQLFLNYQVIFDQLGVPVDPIILPIAYIEAILNFAQMKSATLETDSPKLTKLQHAK